MKMIEFEKAKNAVLDLLVGKVSTIRAVLIVKALEDLSVDAVPVVRCDKCRHYHEEVGWCDIHSHFIGADWTTFDEDFFCKDGERAEGAEQ